MASEASFSLAGAEGTAKWKTRYKGWQCIPIQHQQLDPNFQIVSQQSVAAYAGTGGARREPAPPKPADRVLDGDLLLRESQEASPVDVYGARLPSCNIVDVAVEDCPFFVNLANLDLADNNCQLERLAAFPAVRSLSLQCNKLETLGVPVGGFPRLEVLNLSHNSVSASALLALAAVGGLRELDLSHNHMGALPSDWSAFRKLTRLSVADNDLRGDEALSALASVPSLTELNLEANAFDSLGPLILAGLESVDCKDTGGYRGAWSTLQRLNFARNDLRSVGGIQEMLTLPSFKDLDISGTAAVKSKSAGAELYLLRKAFDDCDVELFVGHVPLYSVPAPKMGSAYTKAAPTMLHVSERVTQNEYATNPDLWDILGSDSEDEEHDAGPSDSSSCPCRARARLACTGRSHSGGR